MDICEALKMQKTLPVIYFDNNATTPIDKKVLDAMFPFLTGNFANPSSAHNFGIQVNQAINKARLQIADLIGANQSEIVFTSGSTEAINIALKGIAKSNSNRGNHIITVTTEHLAVLDTCKYLEEEGFEVTYLSVNSKGLVDLGELKDALRPDTILVSVMYVNNETGVIQPIREIAALAHDSGSLFMTDATQAVGKVDIDVDTLGIDLLCLSAHKIYGPKGVGALYVRNRYNKVKLPTYLHGGGHEQGIRSGTLNSAGIVALGKACEICAQQMNEDAKRIGAMRDELETSLLAIQGAYVNGSREHRLYNVTNICFPGLDADILIGKLGDIAVSNGSACTSAIIEPSHVLLAMGLNDKSAFSSIRFSLGRFNTDEEVQKVITAVTNEVKLLSDMYN
jgi:cysteine desulfurase